MVHMHSAIYQTLPIQAEFAPHAIPLQIPSHVAIASDAANESLLFKWICNYILSNVMEEK